MTQKDYDALFARLVCNPQSEHYKKLGKVGWLLMYFLIKADDNGMCRCAVAQIAQEMGLYKTTIKAWLRHLEKFGYITLIGNWDKLTVSIEKPIFTACSQNLAQKENCAENSLSNPDIVTINDNSRHDISDNNDRTDRDDKSIYKRNDNDRDSQKRMSPESIAEVFGDNDNLAFYAHAFRTYPKRIIKKAYLQTLQTPSEKIKRSRGALFNYLLKKYNDELK